MFTLPRPIRLAIAVDLHHLPMTADRSTGAMDRTQKEST